jgi:cyclopropane-fatty-acyl-phospholipid synthase
VNAAGLLTPLLSRMLGPAPPLRVDFWDGSSFGPDDVPARVVMRSPCALQRLLRSPGELGLGRAYVAGDLDIEGDVYAVLALHDVRSDLRLSAAEWIVALRAAAGVGALKPGRLPVVPEEARLHGRRHSKARDAAAISHHYDVGNDFYRMVLGPSLTYSCAYFNSPDQSLDDAQRDKHELICRKLRLQQGERLLDVGCGWGSMAIHAAKTRRIRVVGVTLSEPQADLAAKRAAEAGVADLVEIRVQDERDVSDGPFDAISSVGMFEHVGTGRLAEYFTHLHAMLRPQGRLLNHGISSPPTVLAGSRDPARSRFIRKGNRKSRFARKSFIDSFVFPDGELHEVGRVTSCMQESGFEVRDVESLREHYALTLRNWVNNLEAQRDEAISLTSEGRYRVWRLYMAASAVNFEMGRTQIHQIVGVRSDDGRSGVPLRRGDTIL